jgi:hypothetical protein
MTLAVDAAGPVRYTILSWKYPTSLPMAGLEFEIWTQTNVPIPELKWGVKNGKTNFYAEPLTFGTNWTKVANVLNTPVIIPNTYPNQFFILRATNLVTKKCSEWGKNPAAPKALK